MENFKRKKIDSGNEKKKPIVAKKSFAIGFFYNILTNSHFYQIDFYIFRIYNVYTKYREKEVIKMAVINIRVNDEVKKEALNLWNLICQLQ